MVNQAPSGFPHGVTQTILSPPHTQYEEQRLPTWIAITESFFLDQIFNQPSTFPSLTQSRFSSTHSRCEQLRFTTLIALADRCFWDQKAGIFNSITRQQCTRMIFNTLSTDMRRNLSCYPHIAAGSESVSSFIPRKWGQAQTVLERRILYGKAKRI